MVGLDHLQRRDEIERLLTVASEEGVVGELFEHLLGLCQCHAQVPADGPDLGESRLVGQRRKVEGVGERESV